MQAGAAACAPQLGLLSRAGPARCMHQCRQTRAPWGASWRTSDMRGSSSSMPRSFTWPTSPVSIADSTAPCCCRKWGPPSSRQLVAACMAACMCSAPGRGVRQPKQDAACCTAMLGCKSCQQGVLAASQTVRRAGGPGWSVHAAGLDALGCDSRAAGECTEPRQLAAPVEACMIGCRRGNRPSRPGSGPGALRSATTHSCRPSSSRLSSSGCTQHCQAILLAGVSGKHPARSDGQAGSVSGCSACEGMSRTPVQPSTPHDPGSS